MTVNASHRPSPLPIRAHPLVLGVVLFLASELMFFAALFATYFDLRANARIWPPPGVHLDLLQSSIGTCLLLLSSAIMILTTRALDRQRDRAARAWIAAAVICGLGFAAIAVNGYIHDTFSISSSAYGSIYYAMTGFHLLHVLVGVGILTALFFGIASPALRVNRRAGAEGMMYYWHFVFVVWIGIWTTIYFIR